MYSFLCHFQTISSSSLSRILLSCITTFLEHSFIKNPCSQLIMGCSSRSCCMITLCFFFLSCIPARSDNTEHSKSLLKFKESLTNATMLQYGWQQPAANLCSPAWTGCKCSNGVFRTLQLEGMGLGGKIDTDSLSSLPLYGFSVANNNFSGPFPSGINKLVSLRQLFLSNNRFSGEIPDDAFAGMKGMRRVVLGDNEFTGNIPLSLLQLPKLVDLKLQDNQFGGRIPDFWQKDLEVNFSYNMLEGSIPSTLKNKDASLFSGNIKLCGTPLERCQPKNSILKVVMIIAVTTGVASAATVIVFLILRRYVNLPKNKKSVEKSLSREQAFSESSDLKSEEHGKLCFVGDGRGRFELNELLTASAEVLGSGTFASSYKTVLFSGQTYVVRRFRQMNGLGRDGFYEHMRRLGALSHRNLLPLVAFYYRREEKLLITDFAENGSLASHLHGKKGSNEPGLDWPARLRIIKGVSRGLLHLYKHLPSLTLPHGHLKSSNVLLNTTFEPLLADYGLSPVMNKTHAEQLMVAHKSPESMQNGSLTRKTDVWSLGILILETLTGKFPENYMEQGRGPGSDLATWVNSVVREGWTGEVFDQDMNWSRQGEVQMLKLLKIGMCCSEWDVEKRWELMKAAVKIEEVKEKDSDEDCSSYASEVYSSTAMTDEDFSLSKA